MISIVKSSGAKSSGEINSGSTGCAGVAQSPCQRYGVLVVLFLCLFGLFGCGYHIAGTGGKMPGGVTELSIPVFINRTGKPDIEATATRLFAEEFRSTVYVVESAKARLEGELLSYGLRAVSYTKNDINLEYRLSVTFALRIVIVETGEVVWEDNNVTDYEDFIVNTANIIATEEAELTVFRKLVTDTARNIKERMLDNF